MTKAKTVEAPKPRETLPERIAEAREKVETLRDQRAEAALDGRAFDNGSLMEAEKALEALEDAAGLHRRKEREAADESHRSLQETKRKAILDLEDKRRTAVEEAEALARTMVDAMLRAEERRREIAAEVIAGGWNLPLELSGVTQERRLSQALSAVMTGLKGPPGGRFGNLDLSPPPNSPRGGEAWLKAEDAATKSLKFQLEKEE
ncbi:MAG: hypothetical protein ACQEUZ_01870 [Pseudomonadota bacterium]